MTSTDTTTYANGAIRDVGDPGHANTERNPRGSDSCPACPGVAEELGHGQSLACPGHKTMARDTDRAEAPDPDTSGGDRLPGVQVATEPAGPRTAAQTPGPELRRAPGARQGTFQRDLTGGAR